MNKTKEIVNHKEEPQTAPFVTLSMDSIVDAYQKLHDAEAFYLYLYLCGNRNGYETTFSAEKLASKCGQPANLIEKNFDKLVQAKILIPNEKNENRYDFYANERMLSWGA